MYNLTTTQALFIKVLKMRFKCSNRVIHFLFTNRYSLDMPFTLVDGVEDEVMCNQIAGLHLCEAAMNKLEEKTEDGWV